jgi:hypothetical protein
MVKCMEGSREWGYYRYQQMQCNLLNMPVILTMQQPAVRLYISPDPTPSFADPEPGSGDFLTSESWIRNKFFWIADHTQS